MRTASGDPISLLHQPFFLSTHPPPLCSAAREEGKFVDRGCSNGKKGEDFVQEALG